MMKFNEWMESQEMISDPKASEIIYVGAILTKESQENLYKSIKAKVTIPDDWKKICHHMTIRFRPKENDKLPVFGEDVTLIVTEIFHDDRGVAVKVEPNTSKDELNMPSGQVPHVTVAVSPGTQPVYSNELLLKGNKIKMPQALILRAFIGAKTKRDVFPARVDAALENF